MSVDDWARREAKQYAYGDVYGDIQLAFRVGVASLADVLLSDEAVEAAARRGWANDDWQWLCERVPDVPRQLRDDARAALQAAVDAVTKEARND